MINDISLNSIKGDKLFNILVRFINFFLALTPFIFAFLWSYISIALLKCYKSSNIL